MLRRAADALEEARAELLPLLVREAGKTLPNAVAEIREAADFLRYYGTYFTYTQEGISVEKGGYCFRKKPHHSRGLVVLLQNTRQLQEGSRQLQEKGSLFDRHMASTK